MVDVLVFCGFAALVTFVLGIFARQIGTVAGLMDTPGERKRHQEPTPLIGGLAIIAGALPAMIAAIVHTTTPQHAGQLLAFTAAILAIVLLGLLDDRHEIGPLPRILVALAIFGTLGALSGQFNVRYLTFGLGSFELGFELTIISMVFTVLCIVALINAVNMADGKNGLVLGVSIGWVLLLMTRMPSVLILLSSIFLAVLVTLLVFNLRGRIFLGDGGAYGIGATVGLLAISTYNLSGPYHGRSITADEIAVLFAVPVVDSFRVMGHRMLRGKSPFEGDRQHLHHLLQDRFSWPWSLIAYWVLALLPGAILILAAPFRGDVTTTLPWHQIALVGG